MSTTACDKDYKCKSCGAEWFGQIDAHWCPVAINVPQQEKTEPGGVCWIKNCGKPAAGWSFVQGGTRLYCERHGPPINGFEYFKPDLSLLPGPALRLVAAAMQDGADKYGRDDWRRPDLNLQEYASKAIGHIYEWLEGRDKDETSGVDPLAHAAADLLFIIWHNQNWTGKARRPGVNVAEASDG